MKENPGTKKGRGAVWNPPNRFEPIELEPDPELAAGETGPPTRFYRDNTREILAYNDSPDVGFSVSINPYRGCEHGCIYCYARPTHEYFGLSSGLDFESKIFVKLDAPRLLRQALSAPGWQPQTIGVSGVTDPYQPVERRLQLTRQCLQVLAEFCNPVAVVSKNFLVTRDVDLLGQLAEQRAAAVILSITTLDGELARRMEPRTSTPERRLRALEELSRAGIPCGVLVAPVIPGLTDHELPAILQAAAGAGASFASYIVLRLPFSLKTLFTRWLETHYPARKQKILHRIQQMRGGQLNDPRFGSRMRGEGIFARQIAQLFETACRRWGLQMGGPVLNTAAFRRPGAQLRLF